MQSKLRLLALTSLACAAATGVVIACSGDDVTGGASASDDGGLAVDSSAPIATGTTTGTAPVTTPPTEEDAGAVQDAATIDPDAAVIDDPDPEDDAGVDGGPAAVPCNTLTATNKIGAVCSTTQLRLNGGALVDGTYDLVSVTVPQKACDAFSVTSHTGTLTITGAKTAKATFQYYVSTQVTGIKRPSTVRRTFAVTADSTSPLDVDYSCPAAALDESWSYSTSADAKTGAQNLTLYAPYANANAYFRFVKPAPVKTL